MVERKDKSVNTRSLATTGIFVLGVLYTLYFAQGFLVPVVLALFLNFLLNPVMRALQRLRVPSPAAAGCVVVLLVAAMGLAFITLRPPVTRYIATAPESLRTAELKVRQLLAPAIGLTAAAEKVQEITAGNGQEKPQKVQIEPSRPAETLIGRTARFAVSAIMVLVLLFFLLATGHLWTTEVVRFFLRRDEKSEAHHIIRDVEETISRYLFTVAVINTCLGVVVGLAMFWLNMPNPVIWGLMAVALNFIPYFGPLVGSLVLAVVGLLHFESWTQGFFPALCYLVVHGIESNLITPTVLGKRLWLNPVAIFLSLMFWGWLWGIAGTLLAVPILMTFKIFCDHIESLKPVGNFLMR